MLKISLKKPYSYTKKSSAKKSWKLILLVILLVVGIAIIVLELTNTTHIFHKRKATSGIIPVASANNDTPSISSSKKSVSSGAQQKPATSAPSTKSTTPTSTDGTLVAPYGTFVSNHNPSLSNAPNSPSHEQSTCITTPGATCTITFTNKDATKTLGSKVADSSGAASWDWDVVQAGFTEDSWTITATSTLNGQSKSTKDSLELKVGS